VAFLVERLVIRPIRQLQQSANAIARGAYEVRIPTYHDDEVGDLSRAFNKMAQQVAEHTTLLEAKVKERTLALEQSNRLVQEANRKLGDSIDYASLIQQAILPDRVMSQRLGQGYSVLWRPRDVVGGDFYVFHDHQDGYLVGIIDCAGHGVPGALMTMLVRAAVDRAIHELGVQNPAKLLQHIDSTVRNMLNEESVSARVATNADAGLVFIPKQGGTLRFSGAKIPLYRVVDGAVERIKASRRALADGKVGEFENVDIDGGNSTFCLTTDGFLDQSGGHKRFGFGNKRFEQLLLQCSSLGLDDQIQQLEQSLLEYMGDNAQRDDITLLMFRVSDTAIGEKEC
jgi:serine phosphatase RsbU (regulator of sigma subunit)